MAGLQVVVVKTDARGNIDLADLRAKAEAARHGARRADDHLSVDARRVRGEHPRSLRHRPRHGGQVYMDGANMNAQVGPVPPGRHRRRRLPPQPAQDVLHPARRRRSGHGADRRGARTSRRSCPGIRCADVGGGSKPSGRSSAAPWGSASILPISCMYIDLMGAEGLTRATQGRDPQRELRRPAPRAALPGALQGQPRLVAHECILDCAALQGIGRHRSRGHRQAAHGLRLPRADGLVPRRGHADGRADRERIEGGARSVLRRDDRDPRGDPRDRGRARGPRSTTPSSARRTRWSRSSSNEWDRPYTPREAAFPAPWTRVHKFWPSVGRIDAAYGDRTLVCSVPAHRGVWLRRIDRDPRREREPRADRDPSRIVTGQ